ncbi:MAG: carboxylating nicotinate-nucleotide diphosphorylase [Pseudomonadota bacterium]
MSIARPPKHLIDEAVSRALAEDLGDAGDVTSLATILTDATCRATITARKPGVIAGVDAALSAFDQIDGSIQTTICADDGAAVAPGDSVITLAGPTRGVLGAERVALNFLGALSGVATATAALVDAVAGTTAKITCTRKTTPGLRALQKYAVRCGGGHNHRFGLYDAVMIKDNHVAAAGGVANALAAAKDKAGHMTKIEIEVDTLAQLKEALASGADVILLDNMTLGDLRDAVAINGGRATLEASGNVTLDTVRAIAETGVDVISSGAITHSAPCLDLGLDFQE